MNPPSGEHLLAELKARCPDLAAVRERLRDHGSHETTVRQVDTYFPVPRGRLKLRLVDGRPAQLIYYERPDLPVKASRVHLASVEDGPALRTLLGAALGIRSTVAKTREIWRWKGVQVRLDTVEGWAPSWSFWSRSKDPTLCPTLRSICGGCWRRWASARKTSWSGPTAISCERAER